MKRILILFLAGIFFICLLAMFISAEESIVLNYPEEINLGEEFEVDIELNGFENDIYDFKIDFTKDGKRVSRIWDGDSWQSTFNYLNEVIDTSSSSKETFKINISSNIEGEVVIEVKLRNSKDKVSSFSGYSIDVKGIDEVIEEEDKNVNDKESDEEKQKEEKEDSENNKELDTEKKEIENDNEKNEDTENKIMQVEKEEILEETTIIRLGNQINKTVKPEQIKSEGYIIYESKNEKIKKYAVYFFALQCVILAILIGFKRIS